MCGASIFFFCLRLFVLSADQEFMPYNLLRSKETYTGKTQHETF